MARCMGAVSKPNASCYLVIVACGGAVMAKKRLSRWQIYAIIFPLWFIVGMIAVVTQSTWLVFGGLAAFFLVGFWAQWLRPR